jgi:hypothetical protein
MGAEEGPRVRDMIRRRRKTLMENSRKLTLSIESYGVAPCDIWEELPIGVRASVVSQVAELLAELFALRFDRAGSLYLSSALENLKVIRPIFCGQTSLEST